MSAHGVLLLLALVVLAGCADSPAQGPEVLVDGAPAAIEPLSFLPARSVATLPNTQHEAFVEVFPDGRTLLACAHGFFREPAHFYASTDSGATFVKLSVDEPLPGGGDCEVALSPAGVWAFSEKTGAGVTVVTTADRGATWTVNHLAGPATNVGADRQWLAYAGEVLLLSHQPGTLQFGTVEVMRSLDHGATWSLPTRAVPFDPAHANVGAGHFIVGPDGAIRIPIAASTDVVGLAGDTRLSFAISRDAGATWTEEPVTTVAGRAPYPTGAAQAPDGSITWAYASPGPQIDRLVAIASLDDGRTWTTPVELDAAMEWIRPWASARPDGRVDILWHSNGEAFGANSPRLALARVDLRVDPPIVEAVAIDDIASIEFVAVAHDASGRATVVAADAPATSSDPLGSGDLLVIQETPAEPIK